MKQQRSGAMLASNGCKRFYAWPYSFGAVKVKWLPLLRRSKAGVLPRLALHAACAGFKRTQEKKMDSLASVLLLALCLYHAQCFAAAGVIRQFCCTQGAAASASGVKTLRAAFRGIYRAAQHAYAAACNANSLQKSLILPKCNRSSHAD
ncbi:hypothetical protein NPIL_603801 [Nephila pilipes]|uniref:Uncharacterized protein n=1 Tax=Nephila pilipes TaxID=299642 RepID=A0A8X6N5R6_NEPPI|nr:hypothetical protein NPIL_603801 [Nephila pilipes]